VSSLTALAKVVIVVQVDHRHRFVDSILGHVAEHLRGDPPPKCV
jgi:hypothetical protein